MFVAPWMGGQWARRYMPLRYNDDRQTKQTLSLVQLPSIRHWCRLQYHCSWPTKIGSESLPSSEQHAQCHIPETARCSLLYTTCLFETSCVGVVQISFRDILILITTYSSYYSTSSYYYYYISTQAKTTERQIMARGSYAAIPWANTRIYIWQIKIPCEVHGKSKPPVSIVLV